MQIKLTLACLTNPLFIAVWSAIAFPFMPSDGVQGSLFPNAPATNRERAKACSLRNGLACDRERPPREFATVCVELLHGAIGQMIPIWLRYLTGAAVTREMQMNCDHMEHPTSHDTN